VALHQLIYISRNRRLPNERSQLPKMRDILKTAVEHNARAQLTGFLILRNDWFLQVLEGEESKVIALYSKIAKDPRHEECLILRRQNILYRSFEGWAMGGGVLTPEHEAIYLEYGIGGDFDPRDMNPQRAHNLALDLMLHDQGKRRKVA
jgi:Sensors of blue-light using FAD